MPDLIQQAETQLLLPVGMDLDHLAKVFSPLQHKGFDLADIYLQLAHDESWSIEDGLMKGGSYRVDKGAGIRAVSGEKTGFAYSNDLQRFALEEATLAAGSLAKQGQGRTLPLLRPQGNPPPLYPDDNPLNALPDQEKIYLLQAVDRHIRAKDGRVKQVMANLHGQYEVILVLNHLGRIAVDFRPLVRFSVQVILETGGKRTQGYAGGGGRGNYQTYLPLSTCLSWAEDALRQAQVNLEAVPAPAGEMPVVLGPGWPGVLLHEAIGHGLEGDFNRKGSSAFSGRIGERVASPVCTIVDDGTLVGRRGSLTIDDEGNPTQCTTLIEKGILKQYMQDELNAKLMGTESTGNGRRESFAHLPLPRMTNTYMLPGAYAPEEIIASVDKGIYAVNFAGGQVDITSGKFVFSASEAYLIEKGKITQPVKGATLSGHGPAVLTHVSMVGSDLALDSGIGVCGKEGQSIPVGVGQPTLKLDKLIVGGTG